MRIVIDKFICFDDVSGVLTNLDTSDVISLPVTASLIFSYMIQHQGKIIERTEIFENVWSKYGQTPSNNTLTQYISLIRKNLSNLGLPTEVIVTIPKVGFIIPLEVDIDIPLITQVVVQGNLEKSSTKSKLYIISSIILLTAMLSAFYYWTTFRLNEQVTYHLGYVNKCEVRGLSVMTPAQVSSSLERTKRYAELYLPCTVDTTYYIGLPHLATGKLSSRFTLAQCSMSKVYDEKLISCKSLRFYE